MNFCTICATANKFQEFRGRSAEQCTRCGSLERQRAIFLFLTMKNCLKNIGTDDFDKRILHFAPEPMLFNAFSNNGKNRNYRCFDYSPGSYGFTGNFIGRHDLADMEGTKKLPPADIIIHNHVLEHIPADFAETIQALNSLLVPGGIQAFTIPIRPGKFDEDLSPSLSDDERRQRFYQEDHVRIFGTDDAVPMMQSIMKTDKVVFRLNEHISPELAAAYGLTTTYKADRIDSVCSNTVFYYIKPL